MSDPSKITAEHRRRSALVYVRQSTTAQVEHHGESTDRQYRLVERAVELGWPREQVHVVDQDLGISGAGLADRSGFAQMTAQVALGHVGIVLGLEVSRLARNNADWYRLLDLCGATDTLIADADGIYHPAWFNDRLVLGLKGTMSEAELHVLRARLEGGIRNKAARGELRGGCPLGWCGGKKMARSASTPTSPSPGPSERSSSASPSWARHARSGSGSAPRDCASPCSRARSTGSGG
jgi:DNA invertase Pin-like site-specific DNA recombinase